MPDPAKDKDPAAQPLTAGFDLGGTKMRVALFTPDFTVAARAEAKTRHIAIPKAGAEKIAALIAEALAAARADRPRAQLAGLGLAIPGPVNPAKGIIYELPNIGWRNTPIVKLLQAALRVPVAIMNDVDAGLTGEYHFGAAKGAHTALGIFPGTGIGGAAITVGRLLTGSDITCMEIGHLPVLPDGPLCGCGQNGCLEAVASRLAIAQAAAAAVQRGQAPNLKDLAGTDIAEIRSRTLAKAIKAGDTVIEQIVRQAARHIGHAAAAAVNLLAADSVILGGGLVEAMPDIFEAEVTAAAKSRCMTAYRDRFRVHLAKLGDDAAIYGAARCAAG